MTELNQDKQHYYAGIGSRKTPDTILADMRHIATVLEQQGYILRSGGADGADQAFEDGVNQSWNKEIILPWNGFNKKSTSRLGYTLLPDRMVPAAMEMASQIHPAWDRCSSVARAFHARNMAQILGPWLDRPVEFVVCWTPKGETVGGTATAIRLAQQKNIPVINLALVALREAGEMIQDIMEKNK